MLRTHTCGELSGKCTGEKVSLCGWVHKRRDHGEIIFIDLRDAYGITQIVFDPEDNRVMHDKAHDLKSEYVIQIKGNVRNRPDGTINKKIPTGEIEVLAGALDNADVPSSEPDCRASRWPRT